MRNKKEQMLQPKSILAQKYIIDYHIASGTYGDVYAA